jgi:hypothetical protein
MDREQVGALVHGYGADVQKMRDADLSGIITKGKGKMAPYKTMRSDQVNHMDAFIQEVSSAVGFWHEARFVQRNSQRRK